MRHLIILSFFLNCSIFSFAQADEFNDESNADLWGTIGMGYSSGNSLGFYGNVSIYGDNTIFTIRGSFSYKNPDDAFGSEEEELKGPRRWDTGFMLGRAIANSIGWVSFSGGLGVTGGTLPSIWDANNPDNFVSFRRPRGSIKVAENHFITLGILVETQAVWTPSDQIGLAITVWADLNPVRPFVGTGLSIAVPILED